MTTATWYLTGSQNPFVRAVDPGQISIGVPAGVLDWAVQNGLSMDDPDVYMLVTTDEFPGEVIGLIGSMDTEVSDADAAVIERAITELDAERAELDEWRQV